MKQRIENVALGSDAEVFLHDATGRFFPVCGLVGGTKAKPKPLPIPGYFIQEDNCALEFNIPVCKDMNAWNTAFNTAHELISAALPGHFHIVATSVADFDPAFLNIPQTQQFGCEPDFNAWEVNMNARPEVPKGREGMRTAAAHVHISWDNPDEDTRIDLVRASDIFVALADLSESADRTRRQMYGRAGAFRMKEYGVEHRVLSNDWIWQRASSVWARYMRAIQFVNANGKIEEQDMIPIQQSINNYDMPTGNELMHKYTEIWQKLCAPVITSKPSPIKFKKQLDPRFTFKSTVEPF